MPGAAEEKGEPSGPLQALPGEEGSQRARPRRVPDAGSPCQGLSARAADCAVHRGQSFQVPSQRQYPKTGDCDCRGFSDFLFLSLTASASSLPGAARSVAASQ